METVNNEAALISSITGTVSKTGIDVPLEAMFDEFIVFISKTDFS